MAPRTHQEIRQAFQDYFEQHQHRVVPSYSLLPPDDPTLLFVNAGMVQFKDVFTGKKSVDYVRATSVQKCLRVSGKHNDLDNVGRTARHHTFFEMLGNFSFGDYFKRDAIRFGWEFLTETIGLDDKKLWVSVHPDDDETYDFWIESIGVPKERVVRDPENFWSMGDTGPCGPCSEVYIDQGPIKPEWVDAVCGDEEDRFLELWNFVFMQYDRDASGTLTPLPKPSIDTGMGLERILAASQGKISNYDTDLFQPLIQVAVDKTGGSYQATDGPFDTACRVLADHARAAAFLIADGIYPSNEGRGYVLRRVLRRAIRFGRSIGMEDASVSLVADRVVEIMSDAYPELADTREVIQRVLLLEEDRFGKTLADGEKLLARAIDQVVETGNDKIPGDVAFTLHDTHGFPLDLTELIARERGLAVDKDGFKQALEEQRARSRQGQSFVADGKDDALESLVASGASSDFVGYELETSQATVVGLVCDGSLVDALKPGSAGEVILDVTPFYAESGGQVGDVGTIEGPGGAIFTVEDTQKYTDRLIRHIGTLSSGSGELAANVPVSAKIDVGKRDQTRANHSATHLLHCALRAVLGDHVRQRGSLVGPDRLRFDFSHFGPMSVDEIEAVELRVNALVQSNDGAVTQELGFDEAVKTGATAFFEEKYGDTVRVLTIGPSVELCGGTHVQSTGDIGAFTVIQESSLQSGVRRVECRTGLSALGHLQGVRRQAQATARTLNTNINDISEKTEQLLKQRRSLEKALEKAVASQAAGDQKGKDLGNFNGVQVQAIHLTDVDKKSLLPMLDEIRKTLNSTAVLMTNQVKGRLAVTLGVTEDLTERLHAGNLLKAVLNEVGGRGGGRATTAQGGLEQADGDTIETLEHVVVRVISEASGNS